MNNADMPAMPVEVCTTDGIDINGKQTSNRSWVEIGLTKREEFAARAMLGLITDGSRDPDYVAARSIEYADALLAALEEAE